MARVLGIHWRWRWDDAVLLIHGGRRPRPLWVVAVRWCVGLGGEAVLLRPLCNLANDRCTTPLSPALDGARVPSKERDGRALVEGARLVWLTLWLVLDNLTMRR